MNKVELVGRLTAKPELRYTASNMAYARFSVAITRTYSNAQGERGTDFINVVVWGKQAENVANYLDKGRLVAVEGSIQTGSYTDKDGNKRTSFDVRANNVEFLSSRTQGGESNDSSNDMYEAPSNDIDLENDPYSEFGDSVSIDDNFLD